MLKRTWMLSLLVALMVTTGCVSPIVLEDSAPAAATSATETQAAAGESITIIDSLGTEHVIDLPVTSVIPVNRQISEALTLIGAADRVIATGDTTTENNAYLPFAELPDVGETGELNLELIVSLQPDIVFAKTNTAVGDLESVLEPAGIQVVRLDYFRPDRQKDELRILGQIMQEEENAEAFIAWQEEVEAVRDERLAGLSEEERATVLALSVGFLNSNGGYRIFPSQSADGSMGPGEGYATVLAGGVDAASDLVWPPDQTSGTTVLVDEEYALALNPDAVTLHGTWLGGYNAADDSQYREVMQNIIDTTSLPQMDAVENGNVFIFHTDFLGAARNFIGTLQLAKYLYPERFADVDPLAYDRTYFAEWLGVPYGGVWSFDIKSLE